MGSNPAQRTQPPSAERTYRSGATAWGRFQDAYKRIERLDNDGQDSDPRDGFVRYDNRDGSVSLASCASTPSGFQYRLARLDADSRLLEAEVAECRNDGHSFVHATHFERGGDGGWAAVQTVGYEPEAAVWQLDGNEAALGIQTVSAKLEDAWSLTR